MRQILGLISLLIVGAFAHATPFECKTIQSGNRQILIQIENGTKVVSATPSGPSLLPSIIFGYTISRGPSTQYLGLGEGSVSDKQIDLILNDQNDDRTLGKLKAAADAPGHLIGSFTHDILTNGVAVPIACTPAG